MNNVIFRPFSLKGKDKRENGNIVDQMGSLLVMVMMFAMILALVSYGKLISMRLSIDNIVRNYLYIEEQEGYLSGYSSDSTGYDKNYRDLVNSLTSAGCTSVIIEPDTTHEQVSYGSPVTIHVTVGFPNDLFNNLGAESKPGNTWFTVRGLRRNIEYSVSYTSTSRW